MGAEQSRKLAPTQPKLKESNTVGGKFAFHLSRVCNPQPDSLTGQNDLQQIFLLRSRETVFVFRSKERSSFGFHLFEKSEE